MNQYTELVAAPKPSDINGGKTPCPTAYLVNKYGMPRSVLGNDCQNVTAPFWKSRLVTESVGKFRVTGHRLAVEQLRLGFAAIKVEQPELYQLIGTAGMLCCRRVRGGKMLSNHGLGLAVDLTIGGKLDEFADGKTQKGLFTVYSVLKRFGWYWLAENGKREDSMHFELSGETVMEAIRAGTF